jgi:hypothetical protein
LDDNEKYLRRSFVLVVAAAVTYCFVVVYSFGYAAGAVAHSEGRVIVIESNVVVSKDTKCP